MSEPVPVPRAALAAALLVVLLLVGAVAFLLGRGTSPSPPQVVMVPAAAGAGAPPSPSSDVFRLVPAPPDAPSVPVTAPEAPAPPPPPRAQEPPPRVGPSEEERAAVRAYFDEVENELAAAAVSGDPRKQAMGVLQDLSGEGVRGMEDDQRRARDRIKAIHAPDPCAEHHKMMLKSLDSGIEMLRELRRRMSSGSMGELGEIASQGRQIEADARAVDEVAKAIKVKYGLDE